MDAHIAVGRDPAQTVPAGQSPTPAQQARAAMAAKLTTAEGKAIYARRKCIVEPAFGQIKQARGFRRFSFRGLEKVRGEWSFVCATHNLLKLFRHGFRPALAAAQAEPRPHPVPHLPGPPRRAREARAGATLGLSSRTWAI